METFKPIPGVPRYEVSDLGTVRSNTRLGIRLVQWDTTGDRYPRVCVMFPDGKKKSFRVHILVLITFVGPRPTGQVARHKDDNPQNCKATNLEWGTQKQNIADKKLNGGYRQGEASHMSKLTDAQVLELRSDQRYRYRPKDYADKFGVSKACIVDARIGVTFKHLPSVKELKFT